MEIKNVYDQESLLFSVYSWDIESKYNNLAG